MLETIRALGVSQVSRQATAASGVSTATNSDIALEGLRRRNALLDSIFYDIGVITSQEAASISPWLAREGAILIVPPSKHGNVTLCSSVDAFVAKGGADVSTLSVAGVGSSALGSAAFARNVADALQRPVASVVSGYGLADLMTEALGGFFLFGELNSLRHSFEFLEGFGVAKFAGGEPSAEFAARESGDTRMTVALLTDPRLRFHLLTGHSKGNLVISEALYQIRDQNAERARAIADAASVITISARIAMPPIFKNVIDVMGEWDWFGGINSRKFIKPDVVVPRAWHHTNTDLATHLPVTKTLGKLIGEGLLTPDGPVIGGVSH